MKLEEAEKKETMDVSPPFTLLQEFLATFSHQSVHLGHWSNKLHPRTSNTVTAWSIYQICLRTTISHSIVGILYL